jgi:hypothetical protein
MENVQDINASQYGQMDFNLPHDIVELPSGGVFYKNKKKSVKVGYLTANDENLITSYFNSTSRENIVLGLIRAKLYEPDLRPEDLMYSDIEAILIFLRNTSFGSEYVLNPTDPATDKKFEFTVNLEQLYLKKPNYKPDENGLFTTTLPKTNRVVKLRPLTYAEDLEIVRMGEQYPAGRVAPKVNWRLLKQIVEVDGNTDKEMISKFIDTMPIGDSKYIRNFLNENEPGLDLIKTVNAPSGEKVTIPITFGVEFFRPFF